MDFTSRKVGTVGRFAKGNNIRHKKTYAIWKVPYAGLKKTVRGPT